MSNRHPALLAERHRSMLLEHNRRRQVRIDSMCRRWDALIISWSSVIIVVCRGWDWERKISHLVIGIAITNDKSSTKRQNALSSRRCRHHSIDYKIRWRNVSFSLPNSSAWPMTSPLSRFVTMGIDVCPSVPVTTSKWIERLNTVSVLCLQLEDAPSWLSVSDRCVLPPPLATGQDRDRCHQRLSQWWNWNQ